MATPPAQFKRLTPLVALIPSRRQRCSPSRRTNARRLRRRDGAWTEVSFPWAGRPWRCTWSPGYWRRRGLVSYFEEAGEGSFSGGRDYGLGIREGRFFWYFIFEHRIEEVLGSAVGLFLQPMRSSLSYHTLWEFLSYVRSLANTTRPWAFPDVFPDPNTKKNA